MTQSQKTKDGSYDHVLHYREELVNRNYDNLLGYAISLTKNRADAAELVQQAFFEFFRNNKDQEIVEHLRATKFLFGIVKIQFLKKKQQTSKLNVIPFEPQTLEECIRSESDKEEDKRVVVKFRKYEFSLSINQAKKMKAMIQALTKMPKKYSEVIILRYFEGLSNQEIKDKLNLSKSVFCGRLRNGKNLLRILLNQPLAFWAKSSFSVL